MKKKTAFLTKQNMWTDTFNKETLDYQLSIEYNYSLSPVITEMQIRAHNEMPPHTVG